MANVTLVRFLSSVSPHVNCEAARFGERLVAQAALVSSSTGVYELMYIETVPVAEIALAHITYEWSDINM